MYEARGKKMLTRTIISCLVHFISVLSVDGVSLYLNPPSMEIGSRTLNPTMSLNIHCASKKTFDVDTLLEMKLSRRKFTEPTFTGIASMHFDGVAKLDPTVPSDIQNRSPNITGSVDTGQKSGTMTLTINTQGMGCNDQAEFQCSLEYVNLNHITQTVTDNMNFTVVGSPSEILIDGHEYYDDNGNKLQLNNNSVLNAGTRIKYRCTANVGSFPEAKIVWEMSSEMRSWNGFITYVPTQSSDIIQETSRQDRCLYLRTSTLYYNMTNMDVLGISFRCKVPDFYYVQHGPLISHPFRSVTAGSCLTVGQTTQPGSNINSSTAVAIVLGLMVGVLVVVILILSICLHRYRQELENQEQGRDKPIVRRAHTYVGLTVTRQTSGQYTAFNDIPPDDYVRLEDSLYVDMANTVL